MRPARVRLIDLGFDGAFDTSMSFAQSLIQSIGARTNGNPIAEIEFIRTRDPVTVRTALQADATVVHIMAHGTTDPDGLGFWSEDEETGLTLTELAEAFADDGVGIGADVVYADCCSTAQGRFVRAIRDCIATPIAYIGARRTVDWHEATTFASAFYGSLFKDRGKGLTPVERGVRAAERAIRGYEDIVDGPCPFVVKELTPSRRAQKALAW